MSVSLGISSVNTAIVVARFGGVALEREAAQEKPRSQKKDALLTLSLFSTLHFGLQQHGRWTGLRVVQSFRRSHFSYFSNSFATDAILHRSRSQSEDLSLNQPSISEANNSLTRPRNDGIPLTNEGAHVEMAQLLCVLARSDAAIHPATRLTRLPFDLAGRNRKSTSIRRPTRRTTSRAGWQSRKSAIRPTTTSSRGYRRRSSRRARIMRIMSLSKPQNRAVRIQSRQQRM